jgi:RNA polymerase-binding transcription factor DksA
MTRKGAARRAGLRQALTARRRDLLRGIHDRIREGRTDRSHEVGDEVENSDAEFQLDLDLALLQMRAETLKALDAAIARLDAGKYGFCAEC